MTTPLESPVAVWGALVLAVAICLSVFFVANKALESVPMNHSTNAQPVLNVRKRVP